MTDNQAATYFYRLMILGFACLFIWQLVRPAPSIPPVPLTKYASCYRYGSTVIQLSLDGRFMTSDGDWRWRVEPAVPGKHRDLIRVDGIATREIADRVAFERSSIGRNWEVARDNSFSIEGAIFVPTSCGNGASQ